MLAAHLLTERGVGAQVFEGTEGLAPAPRTLIVTSRMRDLLGPLGGQAVVNEIRRFELFTDGRVATVPLQRPDLVIERATLIRGLAQQAEASGSGILLGRRFMSLEPTGRALTFTVERGQGGALEEERARTVIGADGAFSQVAKTAGWPRLATVPLVQAVVRPPKDLPLDVTRVWFIPEDTPYFYWLIPESPERAVVGLIGEEGQETRQGLERFLENAA